MPTPRRRTDLLHRRQPQSNEPPAAKRGADLLLHLRLAQGRREDRAQHQARLSDRGRQGDDGHGRRRHLQAVRQGRARLRRRADRGDEAHRSHEEGLASSPSRRRRRAAPSRPTPMPSPASARPCKLQTLHLSSPSSSRGEQARLRLSARSYRSPRRLRRAAARRARRRRRGGSAAGRKAHDDRAQLRLGEPARHVALQHAALASPAKPELVIGLVARRAATDRPCR